VSPPQPAIALVLGATRGVGRAIALDLAGRGASVIIPYYDWPDDCAETIRLLEALDGDHFAVPADLRDPDQVKDLLAAAAERYGRLDILINNIERGGMPIVHGPYTPEQWDIEMDTTLKAKWWVFHESLPLLRAGTDAAVINISSIAALVGRCGPAGLIFNDGYAAANRAVSSFTETWARQAAPVRVNELMLGFIEQRHAEGTRGWGLLNQRQRREIIGHTLLGRTGTVDDVVKAVRFLLWEAPYMTGAVIRLDGGYTLGGREVPPMPRGEDDVDIALGTVSPAANKITD